MDDIMLELLVDSTMALTKVIIFRAIDRRSMKKKGKPSVMVLSGNYEIETGKKDRRRMIEIINRAFDKKK